MFGFDMQTVMSDEQASGTNCELKIELAKDCIHSWAVVFESLNREILLPVGK
jgi:hypothetical protein